MITKIDFHTHIFPDKIASRAIDKLSGAANLLPHTNGTLSDTLRNMRANGISKSVVLAIATSEKQMTSVNDFAASIDDEEEIISFGSVFPLCGSALDELKRIKALGLKGIKLHPEYQEFEVADKRVFPIYEFCAQNDLIISFHAGYDLAYMHRCNGTPKSLSVVAKSFPNLKMVCAHMGGFRMWREVSECLAGLQNVWFDTSFICNDMSKQQFFEIYNRHNPEQILFGSDLPWHEGNDECKFIERLGLSDLELASIYHINAIQLLNL